MNDQIRNTRQEVKRYAISCGLNNAMNAIEFIDDVMNNPDDRESVRIRKNLAQERAYEVCLLIRDLYRRATPEELDLMFAAELLRIYPETQSVADIEKVIGDELGFSAEVAALVRLLVTEDDLASEELQETFDTIKCNRLALIVALADRCHIIQNVYEHSTWVAHKYISESKAYYLPMAIYGKEHYRDIVAVITILTEKLKTLLEVSEIFLNRFEVREAELSQDILALHEENATIRGIISDFKAGK